MAVPRPLNLGPKSFSLSYFPPRFFSMQTQKSVGVVQRSYFRLAKRPERRLFRKLEVPIEGRTLANGANLIFALELFAGVSPLWSLGNLSSGAPIKKHIDNDAAAPPLATRAAQSFVR